MTDWTDERILERLTGTFATHEADADPAIAVQIARTTPPRSPRRWPLVGVAAAAILLVASGSLYALTAIEINPGSPAVQNPTTSPIPVVEGAYRALAEAEAARVLATVPVPAGSTKSSSAPAHTLGHLRVFNGPVDESLTHTNWWVVPLAYGNLVEWYDKHTPANVGSAFGPDSTSPSPVGDMDWQIDHSSQAFSDPTVVVSYARLDANTTAIRTDVTLAARYERTAETLVPTTVTNLDITRRAIDGPDRQPLTATVTDPALLSGVVATFNKLDGAMASTSPTACGSPAGIVYVYAMTFHWPGHTLAVDPGAPLCGVGMGLTLDGTELPQTLEAEDAMNLVLQTAIDAS